MRLRFSLRTLFLLMTIVAALCFWFLLPTLTAQRFLTALAAEDYQSADTFFRNADDRFLADWANKRWSFRSSGELLPLTFHQLWRNKRAMHVEITYFAFDQNFSVETYLAATPFGLNKPERLPAYRVGIVTEERGGRTTPKR
jgi:hypothetical protein